MACEHLITKEQLASLARAASPGPWEYQTSNGWRRVGTTAANRGRSDGDVVANEAASPANMAFISAANPAMVLALLDRIAELEQDATRYRWLREFGYGLPRMLDELDAKIDEQIKKHPATTSTAMEPPRCTCPSGNGSLRWPYPRHLPSIPQ